MPKSRKRRPKSRSQSPRKVPKPHELLHDPMVQAMFAVDAAELRGDVTGALAIIAAAGDDFQGGRFWRPWRVERLRQLDALGPLLPRWATSRWLLAQALQWYDAERRLQGIRAVEIAMDVRGGPRTGLDPLEDECRVMDRDWVYRQLVLYDLRGLAWFVRSKASADLLAGADRIHDWAAAPLRGLRLEEVTPLELVWSDLGTGERVETVNLGAASLVDDGECVIGRIVPIEEGLMFESAPLPVPDDVAQEVADDPSGWVDVLRRACRRPSGGDEQPIRTSGLHDFRLLTDVPEALWSSVLATHPSLADAVEHLGVDALPCLGAWLVQPETRDLLLDSDEPDRTRQACASLAEIVPEPAASVLRCVAEGGRTAA